MKNFEAVDKLLENNGFTFEENGEHDNRCYINYDYGTNFEIIANVYSFYLYLYSFETDGFELKIGFFCKKELIEPKVLELMEIWKILKKEFERGEK